jgi:hypothetical protein
VRFPSIDNKNHPKKFENEKSKKKEEKKILTLTGDDL